MRSCSTRKSHTCGPRLAPLGLIAIWVFWRAVASLRREWQGNHMQLLLALPVPGWQLVDAKSVAVLLEAV